MDSQLQKLDDEISTLSVTLNDHWEYASIVGSDACIISGQLRISSSAKLSEPLTFGGFEMHLGQHLAANHHIIRFSDVPGLWTHGLTPFTVGFWHEDPGTGKFAANFRIYVPQQYTDDCEHPDSVASIPLRARVTVTREVMQPRHGDPEKAPSQVTIQREVVLAVRVSADNVVASPLTEAWEFPPSQRDDGSGITQPSAWPAYSRERGNGLSCFGILDHA